MATSIEERFLSFVQENTETGCWEWTGYLNRGYGYMAIAGMSPQAAYRISWQLYNGNIPRGLVIRHRCPYKRKDCCNPEHLKIGTQKQNMADAIEDGTIKRGEQRHLTKLTDEQVRTFKQGLPGHYGYAKEQAKLLAVSQSTLSDIATGRTWKHI